MHEILRKEHRVKDGVDEVFLHIEVTTEDDVFTKAAWLSPADVASYIADESHIEVVAGKLKNKAKIQRPKQLLDESKAHDMEVVRLNNETASKNLEVETVRLQAAQAELSVENAKKAL